MTKFNVTYEIVTPESAEDGDAAERGFEAEGVSLRTALGYINGCEGPIEADSCPISRDCPPRWFTFCKTGYNYETGAEESKSLHLPRTITPSSAMRIARLIRCYGID